MEYQIKPMHLDDYEQVVELWKVTEGVGLSEGDEKASIEKFLARNDGLSAVALDSSGGIVGAVLCGHDGRRAFMYHVAVSKEHRNRGIGRKLVGYCLQELAKLGMQKCNLMVYSNNESGKQFWRNMDWKERPDLALMQKMLRVEG